MLPVQRKTHSQTRMGRNHKGYKPRRGVECPSCRAWKLPHAACMECGFVRAGLSIKLATETDREE